MFSWNVCLIITFEKEHPVHKFSGAKFADKKVFKYFHIIGKVDNNLIKLHCTINV